MPAPNAKCNSNGDGGQSNKRAGIFMKKLIALAALAVSTPAMGASLSASDVKLCKIVGQSAWAVMKGRQDGIAPTFVYETLDNIHRSDTPYIMDLIVTMIQEAYEMPSYFAENQKKKAIDDFEATYELSCFESVMETNRKAVK